MRMEKLYPLNLNSNATDGSSLDNEGIGVLGSFNQAKDKLILPTYEGNSYQNIMKKIGVKPETFRGGNTSQTQKKVYNDLMTERKQTDMKFKYKLKATKIEIAFPR